MLFHTLPVYLAFLRKDWDRYKIFILQRPHSQTAGFSQLGLFFTKTDSRQKSKWCFRKKFREKRNHRLPKRAGIAYYNVCEKRLLQS